MELPVAKYICSGVDGAPRGYHSTGNPASFLAASIALRRANNTTMDMHTAGSPVAERG